MPRTPSDIKLTLGEGGRVVIPASYRKALGFHCGDELIARLEEGEVRIFRQTAALERIQKQIRRTSADHTEEFLAFRKQDSAE